MLDTPVTPRGPVTALFDEVGVPYESWDASTLRRRIDGIDVGRYWPPKSVEDDSFYRDADGEIGALFMPEAGFVDDPQLAAHNLIAAARSFGAECVLNAAVTDVAQTSGRVTGIGLADGTRISSPVVVNAAGPWSSGLNRLAGVGTDFTIGVRPMRQEVHYLDAPEGYSAGTRFGMSIADMDLGTYMRPAPGNKMMVGGTEPECDPLEWIDDPDDASPSVSAEIYFRQTTRAARRLVNLTVPVSPRGVAGVYDVSEDWTPIYDRTELDGYYVAMGTSGNQFKNAPVVGRFMAALVEFVESGHDHDRDPLRFVAERTGNTINLGAFSRRRPFNANSTGTVMG
jgi:glycine/D-amino acid oxidase-like deaminating enzyme